MLRAAKMAVFVRLVKNALLRLAGSSWSSLCGHSRNWNNWPKLLHVRVVLVSPTNGPIGTRPSPGIDSRRKASMLAQAAFLYP